MGLRNLTFTMPSLGLEQAGISPGHYERIITGGINLVPPNSHRFEPSWNMPTTTELTTLVEKLAAAIPNLNLDGEELEEYSTMLLWLQNQVETGEPSERIVLECLDYFKRLESRAA